jgi:TPR repeat protein
MTKIFISYRREDSQYQADRLHAALKPHVADPRDIFIDVDNIPVGVDFVDHLATQVAKCDVLLALIGPGWLNARDPKTGERRLDSADDFVRIEIATALKRGIRVAPVLFDGTPVPAAADLPEDLKLLSRRNGIEIRRASFDADADRMIRGLELAPRGNSPTPTTPKRNAGATASKPAKAGKAGGVAGWLIACIALVAVVAGATGLYLANPFKQAEPAKPAISAAATALAPAQAQVSAQVSAQVAAPPQTSPAVEALRAEIKDMNFNTPKHVSEYDVYRSLSARYPIDVIEQAAAARDPVAMTLLGAAYETEIGVTKDLPRALALYDEACSLGIQRACTNVGMLYARGEAVAKGQAKANSIFEKACQNGDLDGCNNYARALEDSGKLTQARKIFRQACDAGSLGACHNLASSLENGADRGQQYTNAAQLYRQACDGGLYQSCLGLSRLYVVGAGVPQDLAVAKSLRERACTLGKVKKACGG